MATFLEKLQAAGLPIESATEDGAVTGLPGIDMTIEQRQTFHDIILEHFKPAEYQVLIAERIDIQTLKDNYAAAITRLQQIQNATNPTNAQVIQAVRDMAQIQERTLKGIRRLFMG